jgi:hypothetical protein
MTVLRLSLGDDDIRSPTHPVLQPRLLLLGERLTPAEARDRLDACRASAPVFCGSQASLRFGDRIEYSGRSETARATPMSSGRFLLS